MAAGPLGQGWTMFASPPMNFATFLAAVPPNCAPAHNVPFSASNPSEGAEVFAEYFYEDINEQTHSLPPIRIPSQTPGGPPRIFRPSRRLDSATTYIANFTPTHNMVAGTLRNERPDVDNAIGNNIMLPLHTYVERYFSMHPIFDTARRRWRIGCEYQPRSSRWDGSLRKGDWLIYAEFIVAGVTYTNNAPTVWVAAPNDARVNDASAVLRIRWGLIGVEDKNINSINSREWTHTWFTSEKARHRPFRVVKSTARLLFPQIAEVYHVCFLLPHWIATDSRDFAFIDLTGKNLNQNYAVLPVGQTPVRGRGRGQNRGGAIGNGTRGGANNTPAANPPPPTHPAPNQPANDRGRGRGHGRGGGQVGRGGLAGHGTAGADDTTGRLIKLRSCNDAQHAKRIMAEIIVHKLAYYCSINGL